MGQAISNASYSDRSLQRFQKRLLTDLDVLAQVLARPRFGQGARTFGAELELYIVNDLGRPVGANAEIQKALDDPLVTLELNRYNLEYNLAPTRIKGQPFSTMEAQIGDALVRLNETAASFNTHVIAVG